VGHRFPVWYFPARGLWGVVDAISLFRVISPEAFESSGDAATWVWLGIGAGIWVSGIFLLRWGVKRAKKLPGPKS
jgi:hypothetical protein